MVVSHVAQTPLQRQRHINDLLQVRSNRIQRSSDAFEQFEGEFAEIACLSRASGTPQALQPALLQVLDNRQPIAQAGRRGNAGRLGVEGVRLSGLMEASQGFQSGREFRRRRLMCETGLARHPRGQFPEMVFVNKVRLAIASGERHGHNVVARGRDVLQQAVNCQQAVERGVCLRPAPKAKLVARHRHPPDDRAAESAGNTERFHPRLRYVLEPGGQIRKLSSRERAGQGIGCSYGVKLADVSSSSLSSKPACRGNCILDDRGRRSRYAVRSSPFWEPI